MGTGMSSSTVTYLDPVQLATLIREQAPLPPDQRSLLVLDVRDDVSTGWHAGALLCCQPCSRWTPWLQGRERRRRILVRRYAAACRRTFQAATSQVQC